MKLSLSPALVKKMLAGHSSVGLIVGAFMYLICLTGTIAVFYPEFERWEQPNVSEYQTFPVHAITPAIDNYHAQVDELPESLYVVFPTDDLPRTHISDGTNEWFLNADGELTEKPTEGWTHMLKALHVHLHLPQTIGLIIVSIFGVMLAKLTISGVLAHPRIFKDAFRFRFSSHPHQKNTDIHNRLSVWGLPFHIMIAITGAFFGLVGLLALTAAPAYYQGDREALIADVYGEDPIINEAVVPINFEQIFSNLEHQAPNATPIYLVVQNMGKPSQFVEVAATLPQRLIYSEIYRFGADGRYINHQGLSDGLIGRQILYSVYRLHFGHFGGIGTKILYLLLGLAITVVSVTGINIWLAKRAYRDRINDLWCATIWGTPLGLAASAMGFITLQLNPIGVFLLTYIVASGVALKINDPSISVYRLKLANAIMLIFLVSCHSVIYPLSLGNSTFATINICLLSIAASILILSKRPTIIEQTATDTDVALMDR